MTPDTLAQVKVDLNLDEGRRYDVYIDTMGHRSTGVGHNLDAKPLPPDWTYPLSDDQVDGTLDSDVTDAQAELDRDMPWWSTCSENAQRVILNLAFNMGVEKLLGFGTFLRLMRQGDDSAAANDLRGTAWFNEVGERGPRMCARLEGTA